MMRTSVFCLIAFLWVISLPSRAWGQEPYYIHIDKSKGLPSNEIFDIYQDSKGFVWIANNEGLTRYDGAAFKTFTSPSQTSRPGSNIKEDENGRIWYQNFDGYLYYIEEDSLHSLEQEKPAGFYSYGILENKLFSVQPTGFEIYNIKTKQKIINLKMNINNLASTFQDKNNFYAFLDSTLFRIDGKDFNISKITLPKYKIYSNIWHASDGKNLYTGNQELIFKSEQEKFKQIGIIPKNSPLASKIIVIDNSLWICTFNGLYEYDIKTRTYHNYLKGKSVGSAFKDHDGNLWIGTLNDGIYLMTDSNLKLINFQQSPPGKLFRSGDSLYIGTQNDKIICLNLKNSDQKVIYKGKENHGIRLIYYDYLSKNLLFCSQYFNVLNQEGKLIFSKKMAVKDIIPVNNKYFAVANSGFVGLVSFKLSGSNNTWDSIFNKFSRKTEGYNNYSEAPILSWVRGKTVAYNELANCLYFGTNSGLYIVTPHGYKELKYEGQPFYTTKVENYAGKVFALGSQGSIFSILENGKIIKATINGFKNNGVRTFKILDGKLFVICNNILGYIDLVSNKPSVFHLIDLPFFASEINDIETSGDKIFLSLDRGLLVLNKAGYHNSKKLPPFTISNIYINNKSYKTDKNIEVEHWQNEVSISYSILSFNRDPVSLYYNLNGVGWHQTNPESRSLQFSSLAPGNYKLAFRYQPDGKDLQILQFKIKAPFWLEWWFQLSVLMIVAIITYLLYKRRIEEIRKRNDLVAEKLELEKNLNSSILTSVRAQMNPHFFYNALNTIQSFIFSNDKRNASAYLSRFSKLTRMILEMSERENVNLAEELLALKIYLELEEARFNGDFYFELRIAPDIDPEMTHIPTMIVQPYIENAIKHGLLHKRGNKTLIAEFIKMDNDLIIKIEDNGIGRRRSGKLNNLKQSKHISFSSIANQKRIDILNKGTNKISVIYTDKQDKEGESLGTIVTLSIPL